MVGICVVFQHRDNVRRSKPICYAVVLLRMGSCLSVLGCENRVL